MGVVRIRCISPATRATWQTHWEGCAHATFFQGPEWAEVWEEYSEGALLPAAREVEFDDGARAVLPFSVEPRLAGLVHVHHASPAGTHGGWISREALSDRHAERLDAWLARRPRDLRWRVSPFTPNASTTARSPSSAAGAVAETTQALRLDGGFEAALARWRPAARRGVRRAEQAGVRVTPAESLADWRSYYAVYLDSLERWGERASSRYDWRLFESLFRRGSRHVVLWLARVEGEVAAGALCLYAPHHVAYWHGATARRHFETRAAQLLFHEAVRDACARGLRWFDFNPSGGHAGVARFKRGFGAEDLPAPMLRRRSAVTRLVETLAPWARLPRRLRITPAAAGPASAGEESPC
ncbi:MAG: GNAT family N-acetyltransferase [Myxococcota bacterium]|nr:GNAT family N-acetyltransferase [Myxococcota bacterium]